MSLHIRIGELARRAQCPAETIRYYEREGLLPEPTRSAGNYRVYSRAHMERLSFICNCRSLDMTLNEVRQLLHFRDLSQENCDAAHALQSASNAGAGARQTVRARLGFLIPRCARSTSSVIVAIRER